MKLQFLPSFFLLTALVSTFSSCKKKGLNAPEAPSVIQSGSDKYFNLWNGLDSQRTTNPYLLKVINLVKSEMAKSTDTVIKNAGLAINKAANLQLYYSITPTTESAYKLMNDWCEADSTHLIVCYPLDSVSLHPLAYEGKLDSLQATASTFYTTVPAGHPLPPGMGATLIDTLYVPDSTESLVDYFSHLVTGNFSPLFLREIDSRSPDVYRNIESHYANKPILNIQSAGPNSPWVPDWNNGDNMTPEWWGGGPVGGNGTPGIPNGRVTVRDCNNVMEGVRNVKIRLVHFTLFGNFVHWYSTNDIGHFDIGWYPPGPFQLIVNYNSNKIKVKMADVTSGWNIVGSILNAPLHAQDVRMFWSGQAGEQNIDHAFNSLYGLCDVIWNGIQEANQYTVDLGMRSSQSQSQHLTVLAYYRSNRSPNGNAASAPMLAHMGFNSTGVAWMFGQMDMGSSPPNELNDLPDMVVMQAKNNPYPCNELRQTIYHEYGHTLHYFQTSDSYWADNIFNSVSGGGYGDDIDTSPGNFFALSEGWADYVGHTFAFMKYGNNVNDVVEFNAWTQQNVTGNYLALLEQVPTFFNDFIPRGLFFDLTDNNNNEPFDQVNGFNINGIYQTLNPNMNTIQKFRDKWEDLHADPDNQDLFDFYDVE